MAFGISGSDPFRSYSSDKDAGGGMGVYVNKRNQKNKKKEEKKKEEDPKLLDMGEDVDDDNLEIEGLDDGEDFL